MGSPFSHWYDNQTVVHPVGLTALILLAIALLVVPRRYAFVPFLVLSALIPSAQRVVIGGLDFNFIRLLVLAGVVRVFSRGEQRGFRWMPLDTAVLACALLTGIAFVARLHTGAALTLELGVLFDVFGMYLMARVLLRSWQDLDRFALGAIVVSVPSAVFFLIEARTGHNLFSAFGGVPSATVIREGRLRCSGAFGNSILAGCYWASLIPLMAARSFRPNASKVLSAVGVGCAMIVVIACASSTPIMGLTFGAVGTVLYPWRFSLRWVRRGLVAVLVTLHLVMKAPVWHLISRIDLVGGSTGYHRYNLIDKFIHNFGEWWMLGTSDTAHWAWGLVDVANEFVAQGVRGGLAGFISFIVVLVIAYKLNGRVLRRVRGDTPRTAYAYAMGVTLLMHIAMFFGVFYFGQIEVVWYATLAAIASLAAVTLPLAASARAAQEGAAAPAPAALAGAAAAGAAAEPARPVVAGEGAAWAPASLAQGLRPRRPAP